MPRIVDEEHGVSDDPDAWNKKEKKRVKRRIRWMTVLGLLGGLALVVLGCWATGLLAHWYGMVQVLRFRPSQSIAWPPRSGEQDCITAVRRLMRQNTSLQCVGALDVFCFVQFAAWRDPASQAVTEWINPRLTGADTVNQALYWESSRWCHGGRRVRRSRVDAVRVEYRDAARDGRVVVHIVSDEAAVCVQHWVDLFDAQC